MGRFFSMGGLLVAGPHPRPFSREAGEGRLAGVAVIAEATVICARRFFRPVLAVCVAGLLGGLLGACGTNAPNIERYDFGVPVAPANGGQAVPAGPDVAVWAPAWLDTPAVLYRLAYADESRLHAYAQTQWAASPARLVEQALKAVAPADTLRACEPVSDAPARLEIDLLEFSQVFETPQASHVVLRARARLMTGHARAALARRDFDLRAPTPSPDGPGAVHGLRDLAQAFATQAVSWAAGAAPCAAAPGSAVRAPSEISQPASH